MAPSQQISAQRNASGVNAMLDAATRRAEMLAMLELMGSEPETELDELLSLAATICDKPMGAVTLLDDRNQYMKARIGFDDPYLPLQKSICQYTIQGNSVMVVEDTTADTRFDGNDVIHGDGGIRFYAGMPLTLADGRTIGALCVMDTKSASLTAEQLQALEVLGRQVSARLQLRERLAELARSTREIDRTRQMYTTIINNLPVGIYLKNEFGNLIFYNRKMAERFSVSETQWLGKHGRDLFPDSAEEIRRHEEYARRTGRPDESYVELTEKDGTKSYWKSIVVPCEDANGAIVLAGVSIDMTAELRREGEMQRMQDELEEANRKLNSMALTDSLTGLWNRRAFDTRLGDALIAVQRTHHTMALMLLDVDNFKSINDRFGHPFGDSVLQTLVTIMHKVKRAEDVACRIGGEEFALLLLASDAAGAERMTERLLTALHSFHWDKENVTVSMGVAISYDGITPDRLIDMADKALYRAKYAGKDRAIFYTPALD